MTIKYIEGNDVRSMLELARDNTNTLRSRAASVADTVGGLMNSDLQYDARSALMALELIAGLVRKAEEVRNHLLVEILHMDQTEGDLPSRNSIARAAGVSVTKLLNLDAEAEPLPEPDGGW